MATWTKTGKDINILLHEAAEIDPYIGKALEGLGPFEDGYHFTHAVTDLCWNGELDAHDYVIDQNIVVDRNYGDWSRKGEQILVGGHVVYGSKEPGFKLVWRAEMERLPEGPREWGPHPPAVIYTLMLTLTKDKSKTPIKKVAESLGWELISG